MGLLHAFFVGRSFVFMVGLNWRCLVSAKSTGIFFLVHNDWHGLVHFVAIVRGTETTNQPSQA
jgi:hypothetical protein